MPTTSTNALRKISSDSDRTKESRAPALTIPIVIALSSTASTCAEAESSDQVSLRRFFTSSITSGQARRRAAISKAPGALVTLAAGASTFTSAGAASAFTCADTASFFSTTFAAGAGVVIGAMFSARSNRSIRESIPDSPLSPIGKSMRPQISSSIKRGAVAPRI